MKVLVTGAGGFVGSELVRHLVSSGYEVRGMVRNPAAQEMIRSLGAEPIVADLNDIDSLHRAVAGVEKVFHIAALFRQAGLPAAEFFRVNVEGTRNVLDCAIAAGVKTVVHCSTVGVLGHIENPPGTEDTEYNPGDPYQESKAEGEKLFLQYVKEGRIRGSVIRPAMIYGPNDTRTAKLFKTIAKRRFFYVGSGNALVHFVDVRDLAVSFRLASEREDVNGEIFIVAGESSLPLSRLVSIICTLLGVREPWLHLPVKPMQWTGSVCEAICTPLKINPPIFRRRVDFFTKDRCFNCTKASMLLGYKPSQPLIGELIDIINSYVASGVISRDCISKPAAIVRSLDGQIYHWDSDASSLYGWEAEHAVGLTTHSLLQTQFLSTKLELINSKLKFDGDWQGTLVHTGKDGQTLQVESSWKIIDHSHSAGPIVLELNHTSSRKQRRPRMPNLASYSGVPSAFAEYGVMI